MTTSEQPTVEVGTRIPPFQVPLTLQRLVMAAACNRDFAPIHHNPEIARATGAPGPYANTVLLQAYIELTLRRWMGPAGRLHALEFRMKSFNCVGDLLSCSGEVTAVSESNLTGISLGDLMEGAAFVVVDVDVWVESHRGRTVTGHATVELPR